MKINHFWSQKRGKITSRKSFKITSGENQWKTITSGQQKRKKSLPQKFLQSLPVRKTTKKNFCSPKKRGKNHFQKRFENISGEKQWKILTSGHQKRKKSLPEKVLKPLPVINNEKQSLLVTNKEEKITSRKSFKFTSSKKRTWKIITSGHQKRGKNHFQKKF